MNKINKKLIIIIIIGIGILLIDIFFRYFLFQYWINKPMMVHIPGPYLANQYAAYFNSHENLKDYIPLIRINHTDTLLITVVFHTIDVNLFRVIANPILAYLLIIILSIIIVKNKYPQFLLVFAIEGFANTLDSLFSKSITSGKWLFLMNLPPPSHVNGVINTFGFTLPIKIGQSNFVLTNNLCDISFLCLLVFFVIFSIQQYQSKTRVA